MNLEEVINLKKETIIKKEDTNNKAMFLQRLVAYLIDSAIVVFIASLISVPFINNDKVSDLNDKSYELIEKYRSNKISNNEYIAEYMNISDEVEKNVENDILRDAINELSEVQKRRIKKYYFEDKTVYQIAEEENATHQAISKSLKQAIEKLQKILKK